MTLTCAVIEALDPPSKLGQMKTYAGYFLLTLAGVVLALAMTMVMLRWRSYRMRAQRLSETRREALAGVGEHRSVDPWSESGKRLKLANAKGTPSDDTVDLDPGDLTSDDIEPNQPDDDADDDGPDPEPPTRGRRR